MFELQLKSGLAHWCTGLCSIHAFADTGYVMGVQASPDELHAAIDRSREAYEMFRMVPGPQRGEIVRQIREGLFAKVHSLYSFFLNVIYQ